MPQPRSKTVSMKVADECLPIFMNEAEINELFAVCLPKLKKATRRLMRDHQDCEDALQEGLLLAFRKLNQFEGRSPFLTCRWSSILPLQSKLCRCLSLWRNDPPQKTFSSRMNNRKSFERQRGKCPPATSHTVFSPGRVGRGGDCPKAKVDSERLEISAASISS
jgi:hypothetical protein